MNDLKKIEEAVIFLAKAFDGVLTKKPTVLHSVRVGIQLLDNNYSLEVVVAGLLHDVIEDTSVTLDEISKMFGRNVADLVAANTKNPDIMEPHERREELIRRCCKTSTDALAIKVTDVYDNYLYYTTVKNEELVAYCLELKGYVEKYSKDSDYSSYIIETLKLILD